MGLSSLRIFVCEFVTGGGLTGEELTPSLAREGETIAAALIHDLTALPRTQVLTTRDPRLGPAAPGARAIVPFEREDIWACWRRAVREADALWPIAPETGGVLERLSRLAVEEDRVLLGSRADALAVCASKRATAVRLGEHGIPVVPTAASDEPLPPAAAGWVAKPDDGVGSEDIHVFAEAGALKAWLDSNARGRRLVVQPYVAGMPASISALFADGRARVLACNRQDVVLCEGRLRCHGGETGALEAHRPHFARLADAVARALPGLWGYAGIDLVVTAAGPVVVEVNPRLTTSYAGLHAALGRNPAGLVLDLIDKRPAHAGAARASAPAAPGGAGG